MKIAKKRKTKDEILTIRHPEKQGRKALWTGGSTDDLTGPLRHSKVLEPLTVI